MPFELTMHHANLSPGAQVSISKAVLFSACGGQERGEVAEHLAKSWHYVVHEMVKRFHLDQHHWD